MIKFTQEELPFLEDFRVLGLHTFMMNFTINISLTHSLGDTCHFLTFTFFCRETLIWFKTQET